MAEVVRIWYAGDDPADTAFARRLGEAVREFATPALMDVDQLDRDDDAGVRRGTGFVGTPVYVVSPALVAKDWNRAKLLGASPRLGVPGYQAFYLCRGLTFQELSARYPDLAPLIDTVMFGEEQHLPLLLRELREYLPRKRALARRAAREAWGSLLALPLTALGPLLYLLYFAGWPAAAFLVYALFAGAELARGAELAVAAIALYAAGFSLSTLPAFDLWPWLGRRWRVPPLNPSLDLARHFDGRGTAWWVDRACLAAPETGVDPSECPPDDLRRIAQGWLGAARRCGVVRGHGLWLLTVPALVVLAFAAGSPLGWGGGAFVAGLVAPLLYHWATTRVHRLAFMSIGLDPAELERADRQLRTRPQTGLQETTEECLARLTRTQSLASWRVRRRWRRPAPRVFISYAWADDEEHPFAAQLADALAGLGVAHFYDKRGVRAFFSAWRSEVSRALLSATHLVVIIGRHAPSRGVVGREVHLAVHRWQLELFPAAIIVVEPDVADELLARDDLPLVFELILRWCPRLTRAEAADPAVLAHLLRQRQRQGLLCDWLTVLGPAGRLRRLVAEEARAASALARRGEP